MLSGTFGGNMSPSSSDSSDSEDDYLDGIRLTMPQSVHSTPTGKHKGSSETVKEAARRQLDDSYEEKETAAEVAARYRERESKKTMSNPATPIIPGKQKQQQQQQQQDSAHHSRPPQSSLESPSHVLSQAFEPNRPPARGHARRTADEMSSSSSDDEPPRLALREPSPARKTISAHSKPAETTDDKQSRPPPDGDRTGPTPEKAESHSPPPGTFPPGGKILQGGEIVPEEKSAVDEGLSQQKAAAMSDDHQGGGAAVEQHVSPRQAPKEEEDVLLSRMGQLLDRIDGLEKKVREQDELLRRQHAQISDQLAISKASQVVQRNPKCCAVS